MTTDIKYLPSDLFSFHAQYEYKDVKATMRDGEGTAFFQLSDGTRFPVSEDQLAAYMEWFPGFDKS